jgi:Skp family chaperone for outer membrane proteins
MERNPMTTTLRISLMFCLAAVLAPATLAQGTKVGVFDAQLVSESTQMGKGIQEDLTAFTSRKESEIIELQQNVSLMRKQLSEQSLSWSKEKRDSVQKDIQLHLLELQSMQDSASRELELEYTTATKEFREKLVIVVGTFGKDEGFNLILDYSQVAWSDNSVDVTAVIVELFDKMYPRTGG